MKTVIPKPDTSLSRLTDYPIHPPGPPFLFVVQTEGERRGDFTDSSSRVIVSHSSSNVESSLIPGFIAYSLEVVPSEGLIKTLKNKF